MANRCLRTATFALVLALAACKPADGNTQPSASDAPVPAATEAEATVAATGTAFDEAEVALIEGTAGMQAAVVSCNLASRAETERAVAEQRAKYVSKGRDGAAFDRLHGEAFAQSQAKFAAASPQQQSQACAQMKAFGKEFGEAAQQMAEQAKKLQQP